MSVDVFEVVDVVKTETELNVKATINGASKIFEGHFPSSPVVPGVLQLQLVRDILSKEFNKTFTIDSMSRCKFLAVLSPNDTQEINLNITYTTDVLGLFKIGVTGVFGETTFLKFNAICK